MDIVTRERLPKEMLLRLVLVHGVVTPDPTGVLPGRGCYVKKDASAVEAALRKNLFARVFHRALTEEEVAAVKGAL